MDLAHVEVPNNWNPMILQPQGCDEKALSIKIHSIEKPRAKHAVRRFTEQGRRDQWINGDHKLIGLGVGDALKVVQDLIAPPKGTLRE